MSVRNNPLAVFFVPLVPACLFFPASALGAAKETARVKEGSPAAVAADAPAVLWKEPADIQTRSLFYGPGGRQDVPTGRFVFLKEDLNGTNPKFDVRDQSGTKWKVKLGSEARPETAASRIVWAVGYSTNEDYFVPDLQVEGLPAHLHRGQSMLARDGSFHDVRLKREASDEKKVGTWQWRNDPFTGTREWNGLRVMMALINGWDLKDENNAIYRDHGELVYMVSDLGASFGATGRSVPKRRGKGDLSAYRDSKFIRRVTAGTVDFAIPSRPSLVLIFSLKEFVTRLRLEWIGRNIPRQDVQWMARLLARLSPKQIRDAFRAAGYSDEDANDFALVLEQRVAELTRL